MAEIPEIKISYSKHPSFRYPDALLQALCTAQIIVLYQTRDLVYQWAENLPPILEKKWFNQGLCEHLFSKTLSPQLKKLQEAVLITGKSEQLEVLLNDDHFTTSNPHKVSRNTKEIWYHFSICAHKDQQNQTIGLITTATNSSAIKRREKVLNILLREVSHRSKNLLAIIESLARQTERFSLSSQHFMKDFQGRIQVLSRTQDLITDANWLGVPFASLVQIIWEIHHKKKKNQIGITNDNPRLFPNSALYIGLALNELIATSATKKSFSKHKNHLKVGCKIIQEKTTYLKIYWKELNVESSSDSQDLDTFRKKILLHIVPTAVYGRASIKRSNNQFFYELIVPNSQFDEIF